MNDYAQPQGLYNPAMAPGAPHPYYMPPQVQPQVQPVPQQMPAQQPMPQQSTTTNPSQLTPQDLQKVTCVLDESSLKILQEAYAIHSEAIINIGIKLFAETDMYKMYMKKNEYKTEEDHIQDIKVSTKSGFGLTNSNTPVVQETVSQVPTVAPVVW